MVKGRLGWNCKVMLEGWPDFKMMVDTLQWALLHCDYVVSEFLAIMRTLSRGCGGYAHAGRPIGSPKSTQISKNGIF